MTKYGEIEKKLKQLGYKGNVKSNNEKSKSVGKNAD